MISRFLPSCAFLFLLSVWCAPLRAQSRGMDSIQQLIVHAPSDSVRVKQKVALAESFADTTTRLKLMREALNDAKKSSCAWGESYVAIRFGYYYIILQVDYTLATYWTTYSLKICLDHHNASGEAQCYQQLGLITLAFEDEQSALDYFKRSSVINAKLKLYKQLKTNYTMLGLVYSSQEKLDSSLFYYRKSQELCLTHKFSTSVLYVNMCNVFMDLNQLDSAEKYIYLTDSSYAAQKNPYGKQWVSLLSGELELKKGNYTGAIQLIKAPYDHAKATRNAELLGEVLQPYVEAHKKAGLFREAFMLQEELIAFKDSTGGTKNASKVLAIQKKFEESQLAEIEKLKQEKADADYRHGLNGRNRIIWGTVILLAIVSVFGFFVLRGYRQKQKANREILGQKTIIEEKQREMLDSITYAKRLQDAILPPAKLVKGIFPQSFILYKPKDIVAGDFYWMEKSGDHIFIAAADCTGHGVPGAMVSVVCHNALNRAVREFNLAEPGKILDKVRELVLETFEKSDAEVMDGMDISLLCILNTGNGQQVKWAGANNHLWFISGNALTELKADKQPVGKHEHAKPFTTHTVAVPKDGMIYLFTDGYADQFGGPKGKKFRYKQLEELLLSISSIPAEDQKEKLETVFNNWKGNLEQIDDVCIIGIRL